MIKHVAYNNAYYSKKIGWGGRIRTSDHRTKTYCLTTWPRPKTGM